MKFPYEFYRGFYYPVIPVTIVAGKGKIRTSAIVDSGASISIFNSGVMKPTRLDIESGEKRIFQGVSAKLVGYVHKVKIIIADKEIECNVIFSNELASSFNLLGRQGIFSQFKICFDESEKFVEFSAK